MTRDPTRHGGLGAVSTHDWRCPRSIHRGGLRRRRYVGGRPSDHDGDGVRDEQTRGRV